MPRLLYLDSRPSLLSWSQALLHPPKKSRSREMEVEVRAPIVEKRALELPHRAADHPTSKIQLHNNKIQKKILNNKTVKSNNNNSGICLR